MKKLNHISLFENFSESEGYSVVGVFMETQMAVAVLPTSEATAVYESLLDQAASETTDIEITELPSNHDLVVVPLGGQGISTSTEDELANYGSPAHDIVELGRDYDYGDNNEQMVFRANRDLHGFVLLDSAGGTSLLSPEEMIDHIY
jgi:putative intracellular protease/amidase